MLGIRRSAADDYIVDVPNLRYNFIVACLAQKLTDRPMYFCMQILCESVIPKVVNGTLLRFFTCQLLCQKLPGISLSTKLSAHNVVTGVSVL